MKKLNPALIKKYHPSQSHVDASKFRMRMKEYARVVKGVNTGDLKSPGESLAGSTPAMGTTLTEDFMNLFLK